MDTYWCMLVKRENLISRLQVFWHIFWHLQRAGQWLNFCQQRAQFLRWWCSRLPPCHILPGGDMRVTERNPFGLGVICLRNPCRCGFLRHAYCFCWVLLIKLGLCYEFSMLGIAMEDQHPFSVPNLATSLQYTNATRLNPDKSHIWRRDRVPALIAWWCRRSKNYKIAQDEDINNLEALIKKEDIRGCSDQICSAPLPYSHHPLAHRSSWWALCRWRWLCQSHWFEAEKRNRIGKLFAARMAGSWRKRQH